jgi:hypothetical protein
MAFFQPMLKTWGVKSQGDYRVAKVSGAMTVIAANGPVWSMRWSSLTLDAVVWYVRWWWWLPAGFTAGQVITHSLYRLRAYSAVDSGGTSMIPASGEQKMKSNMADSVVGDMRIANTAILTAGTRTVETNPIMTKGLWCPTTTVVNLPEPAPYQGVPTYLAYLSANKLAGYEEGLVLQNDVLQGAGGTVQIVVEACWSEVAPGSLSELDVNILGRDATDGY